MKEIKTSPFQALWGKASAKIDPGHLARALLDLISEPAVLFDAAQSRFLHANSSFLVLTAYSAGELNSLQVLDLFEVFDRTAFSSGEEVQLILKLRNRTTIPIMARMHQVESTSQWYVLRFTTFAEHQQKTRQWQETIIEILTSLPEKMHEQDLTHALGEMFNIPSTLFDTNLVCIYHAQNDAPELIKVKTQERIAFFEELLPASDLVRLSTTHLWMPGKRVTTDLHRAARIGGLSFTASVPLGEPRATTGLLVVGGHDIQPPAMLLPVMELLAAYISMAYEHVIRQENFSKEIQNSTRLGLARDVIYEFIQEGILILNPDLTIRAINPAAELILGYTNNEVSGQPVENILISPDRLPAVLASAAEGVSTPNLESITLHHRDGLTFPADVKVLSYHADGRVLGIVVIFLDISEHEQIRLQTRQLEQRALLGEFMGVFAHEVLNPISNISTGAQVLARRLGPDDPNYELITRMENDCQRLNHQMEALKSYAKPYEPFQEPVDLGSLLVRIIERWRPRMSRVNINPVYQGPEVLPKVLGDWRALEQVFTNLISNATDAMSQTGGILSVKLAVSSDTANRPQLEISVSDNGPGIPDEIRGRIFEPFVTTKSSGTGLGLAITKRIITAHRGKITIDSFPGGTVFTVILPTIEENA
jgi:PAS domain S-box-containing protein